MAREINIRSLYKPLQPWARKNGGEVRYVEFLPSLSLQNYVLCYWLLESTESLNKSYPYGVIADGCMDVFFDLRNPEDSAIMGLSKKFVQFELGTNFKYAGIRFLPTMFPLLFNIDASELTGRSESLSNVFPKLAELIIEKFDVRNRQLSIGTLLDQCLMKLLTTIIPRQKDPRLYYALDRILSCNY